MSKKPHWENDPGFSFDFDDEPGDVLTEEPDVGMTDEEIAAFLSSPTGSVREPALLNVVTADADTDTDTDVNDEHTGAMIAFVPDAATAERLVIAGGEPIEELHLTLVYLGEAAKIVPDRREALTRAVQELARTIPIIDANAFGVAEWNPHDDEMNTALVYSVSGSELDKVYERTLGWASDIMQEFLPEQYSPWVPHVCAAYSNDVGLLNQMVQNLGPVRFDRLRLALAGRQTDVPLYDGTDDVSVEEDEMDEDGYVAAGKQESDVNLKGGNHNLKQYWTHGAGAAKIGWGTDGSFARCVAQLGKYVSRPQGLCAEYHKAATGEWPTQGGKHGIPSAADINITLSEQPVMLADIMNGDTMVDTLDTEHDGSWEGVLAVEDIETGDQRKFSAGSLTWPDPGQYVMPLQWARENLGEHKGSVTVGRINEAWRDADNPRVIRGRGVFNMNDEDGVRAFNQVKDGFLSGISIDPDQVTDADVELIYSTQALEKVDPESQSPLGMFAKPELTVYHAGRIRGATLVAFPAFIEGAIRLTSRATSGATAVTAAVDEPWRAVQHELNLGDEITGLVASTAFAYVRDLDDIVDRQQCRFLHHSIDEDGTVGAPNLVACLAHLNAIADGRTFGLEDGELRQAYDHLAQHIRAAGREVRVWSTDDSMTASLGGTPPPSQWFQNPELTGPTPIVVTDDGRIYGHAAAWSSCHTGFADSCVSPPREPDYSYFTTGEVVTADGDRIPVGQITLGTSHAPTRGVSVAAAIDHYGDTGSAVADVTAGVDDHGIWVAGAVRPGVSGESLHALRASALSGDWRRIGGSLRMVALLAVNVPGFPLPRMATSIKDTRQLSMVASGVINRDKVSVDFNAEVLKLAGACGIPLNGMKKKKTTYDMDLDALREFVLNTDRE